MFTYLKLFINRLTEFLHWRFDLVKTINITEIKNGSPLETLPLLIKFIMMLCVYSPVQTDATLVAKNSNIVGFYMLRPFAYPVACCCVLLGVVASVCTPLQHGRHNTQHCWRNYIVSCCARLHVALSEFRLLTALICTLKPIVFSQCFPTSLFNRTCSQCVNSFFFALMV